MRIAGFHGTWTGVVTPADGRLPVVPVHRGIHTAVVVEVRSAAPFGLVWWQRTIEVALPRPWDIGPAPASVRLAGFGGRHDSGRDQGRATVAPADVVRSVRDYTPGDPIKVVHWAATARAGELMVKELESPVVPALCIAVDLRGPAVDAVEGAASRAAGLALAGLEAGIPVLLLTAEAAGPRSGPVTSPAEVNRRLARAVGGGLPAAPAGIDPVVVAP